MIKMDRILTKTYMKNTHPSLHCISSFEDISNKIYAIQVQVLSFFIVLLFSLFYYNNVLEYVYKQ